MAIELAPLPVPPSVDASRFVDFGREVKGADLGHLDGDSFKQIEELLYKHDVLLFRNCDLSPEQQYAITKAFDPTCENYGHGNNKTEATKQSILHQHIRGIPRMPQVQLIGHGTVHDHEGLALAHLQHPSHTTFHATRVSPADEAGAGATRFYRWHMDAALYDFAPPRVTTLYGICVPQGAPQVCRYDDGSGDELSVPLGTTAFVSGKTTFEILPAALKSVAVRASVRYAPHPFVWMAPARAMSTGLGLGDGGAREAAWGTAAVEGRGCEDVSCGRIVVRLAQLWKNPVTGGLHFQVAGCGVAELIIAPLPEGAKREGALYPDGAHLKDLKTVRELLYKMQRPSIAPELVYPHDWHEKDLILFHNRGVMHSVVGAFKPGQVRVFHQCNLAASDEPTGPSAEDLRKWRRKTFETIRGFGAAKAQVTGDTSKCLKILHISYTKEDAVERDKDKDDKRLADAVGSVTATATGCRHASVDASQSRVSHSRTFYQPPTIFQSFRSAYVYILSAYTTSGSIFEVLDCKGVLEAEKVGDSGCRHAGALLSRFVCGWLSWGCLTVPVAACDKIATQHISLKSASMHKILQQKAYQLVNGCNAPCRTEVEIERWLTATYTPPVHWRFVNMPTPPPWEEIIAPQDRHLTPKLVPPEYAPRKPMVLLKHKYIPSKERPDPPLVHFAFPIHDLKLAYDYAVKHDLVEYYPNTIFNPPPVAKEMMWWNVVQRLSKQVEYELDTPMPYPPTTDASFILAFYNNYNMGEKQLHDEDEEDVIALLQEELGVGPEVRPKWYFDVSDRFDPRKGSDYEDEEDGEESEEESDKEGESDGSDTLTERGSDGNDTEHSTSTLADKSKSMPLAPQISA
ncbi:hypothetical protein EVG20_g7816 [Dentipellis fragilis]|uniref:TauD/TfdA-like domain-containing protein n=1 Tax=Dentipellis fragilis TaxID=205917 RepID=A0A4Y9YCA9_9AGAM|nr:hypothetical protein EVG20_g7816 [Dentipellis fragilis]